MLEGQRINDRYKIIEMIGGGGMSNVYLAHDIILNRDVAIKIMRYDFSSETELQKRFQREALSATSLTHPNIVDVYDVGDEDNLHYIVMEYVKGKTLKQYIQEYAPISPARSVYIMKQLTSAIAHAHDNQIIHRDIKPQNILMDESGDVKITDFGIAMALSATSFTQTNSVLGTVHYLSPEQARGGSATNKSDIYALGIVLYELLTGELPFSGESAVAIALKHLQSETPSVRHFDATIPQSLENVVLKATAKDPFQRYTSVEEMHEDLMTVLSPERANEERFVVPIDDDATKAMPVIKDTAEDEDVDLGKTMVMEKQEEPQKPGKQKRIWPLVLLGLFGSLLATFAILFMFTDIFQPKKTPIPDVTNLTVAEATVKIEEAGFLVGETTERFNEEVETGKIIETSPKAGTLRMKNADIDLVVSKGVEEVEVPDFIGQKYEQVRENLEEEFKKVNVEEEYSERPAGEIIAQDPTSGTKVVMANTEITITISKGKDLVTVADLKGFNSSAIASYEQTSGLKIHVAGEENSDTVSAGNVLRQSPAAGAKIEAGSVVTVYISKGTAEQPTKSYTQTVTIPYELGVIDEETEEVIERPKQKVQIYVQDNRHTMADPVETIEITDDTKYHVRMEIKQGQKAAFRIMSEGKVVMEETIRYEDL